MKHIHTIPWLASVSLLCLGALSAPIPMGSSTADELSFHSVAGRKLEKRSVQHSELKMVDLKVTFDTPDGPQEPEVENPGTRIIDDETLEFLDETLVAGEGRPSKLAREFTTIDNSTTFEGGEEDESATMKNESGLASKKVVFTWNDEDKEFEAKWAEGLDGNDALLGHLVEDADFRGWLPEKKAEEGATWTIPGSEFHNLQEPSGPMGYRPEGSEEKDEADDERDPIEGDIKATYKGTREVDGVTVGVIAFEGKLSSHSESEMEQEEGPSVKSENDNSNEIEGELLWDLGAGHVHALSCESEVKLSTTQTSTLEFGEKSITVKEVRSFEGKKTYRFTCSEKKD